MCAVVCLALFFFECSSDIEIGIFVLTFALFQRQRLMQVNKLTLMRLQWCICECVDAAVKRRRRLRRTHEGGKDVLRAAELVWLVKYH